MYRLCGCASRFEVSIFFTFPLAAKFGKGPVPGTLMGGLLALAKWETSYAGFSRLERRLRPGLAAPQRLPQTLSNFGPV